MLAWILKLRTVLASLALWWQFWATKSKLHFSYFSSQICLYATLYVTTLLCQTNFARPWSIFCWSRIRKISRAAFFVSQPKACIRTILLLPYYSTSSIFHCVCMHSTTLFSVFSTSHNFCVPHHCSSFCICYFTLTLKNKSKSV